MNLGQQAPLPNTAKKLMMKFDRGWRMGKNQHCVVHEKANLVVEPGKFWARVTRWDDNTIIHKNLTWTDCKQINAAFAEACKNIIKTKADEAVIISEDTKKLVDSMLYNKGWQHVPSKDNGIYNVEAKLAVYSDGSVWVWDETAAAGKKPVRDTKAFTKVEQQYISDNYRDAQKIIIASTTK
jgi:hypothetical protein